MQLTAQEIIEFGNTVPSLPKGHAKLTYMAGVNWRKLAARYRDIAADLDPTTEYQEYQTALARAAATNDLAEIARVQETFADAIAVRHEQLAHRRERLAEVYTIDGLHTITKTDIPLDELTPIQFAAIIPFIIQE